MNSYFVLSRLSSVLALKPALRKPVAVFNVKHFKTNDKTAACTRVTSLSVSLNENFTLLSNQFCRNGMSCWQICWPTNLSCQR